MKILVTGSSRLIGSELVRFFDSRAERIVGVDNNMRADFFGPEGDTQWNLTRLSETTRHFSHYHLDIRDRPGLARVFRSEGPFVLIIHSAAQASHDLAASRPFDDFDVNAVGTMNLLETTRQLSPDAVFVFMSTNKVYGDAPNELPLKELDRRWDYARAENYEGISEQIRDNIHSYDVARAIEEIYQNPRCGEVYNLGGGRQNSCSILEAFDHVEQLTGRKMNYEYINKNREGDNQQPHTLQESLLAVGNQQVIGRDLYRDR